MTIIITIKEYDNKVSDDNDDDTDNDNDNKDHGLIDNDVNEEIMMMIIIDKNINSLF